MFQSEPLVQQDNTDANSWVKPRPVDLPVDIDLSVEADPSVGLTATTTLQELAVALATRIQALEDAAP